MAGIVGVWSFAVFIYFKVIFDASFRADISIVSALLMAMIFGFLIFIVSGIYAARLLKYNWSPGRVPAKLPQLIGKTFWHMLGVSLAYSLASRLIIFGFSKKLNRELRIFDYRGRLEEEIVIFVLIIIAPILIHYAMAIFGTYQNTKQVQPPPSYE